MRAAPAAGADTLRQLRAQLPDGSRSVQSVWVWRAFFFLALIGLGFVINLLLAGDALYAGAWAFISAGWFGISMWLWRRHVVDARRHG